MDPIDLLPKTESQQLLKVKLKEQKNNVYGTHKIIKEENSTDESVQVFFLACRLSKKLIRKFFFKESQLEKATHMQITNDDNSNNISKLVNKQNQLYFINKKLKCIYDSAMNIFKALKYNLKTKENCYNLEEYNISLRLIT